MIRALRAPSHAAVTAAGLALLLASACDRAAPPHTRGLSSGGGDRLFHEGRAEPLAAAAAGALYQRPWAVDLGWERRLALAIETGVTHDWTAEGAGDLAFGLGAPEVDVPAVGPLVEVAWLGADGGQVGDPQRVTASPGRWTDLRLRWPDGARRVRFRGLGRRAYLSEPRRRPARRQARPDVVLVSLDTAGRKRLSLYGHRRPTTPRLAAWARRHAVVFEDALAAAGSTLPSHASLLSGRSPLRTGVLERGLTAFSSDLPLLAEHFRDAGYRTVALVGGGFLHPEFGFAHGFDRYVWTERPASEALPGQVAAALRLLDEDDGRPLFLLFHTYGAHAPYSAQGRFAPPPGCESPGLRLGFEPGQDHVLPARPTFEDAQGRPLPAPPNPRACVEWLYDDNLAALDAELGPLLDRFERRDRPLLVAVTADHGEGTGAGGHYGHGWLDPAVMRVLLVLAGPGWPAGTRRTDLACSEDVAPTLLSAAGLGSTSPMDGRPLFGPQPARGCDVVAPNPWLTLGRRRPDGSLVGVNVAPELRQRVAFFPRFTRPGEVATPLDRGAAEAAPLLAALEDLARRRQLTLVHDGRGVLEVEVGSSPDGVWAALPPCDCMDTAVDDEFRLRFVAPSAVNLALTHHARGQLRVRLDGVPFTFDLGPQPLHEELFEAERGWARRAVPATQPLPARGVRLTWPGVAAATTPRGADETLRALGYVR